MSTSPSGSSAVRVRPAHQAGTPLSRSAAPTSRFRGRRPPGARFGVFESSGRVALTRTRTRTVSPSRAWAGRAKSRWPSTRMDPARSNGIGRRATLESSEPTTYSKVAEPIARSSLAVNSIAMRASGRTARGGVVIPITRSNRGGASGLMLMWTVLAVRNVLPFCSATITSERSPSRINWNRAIPTRYSEVRAMGISSRRAHARPPFQEGCRRWPREVQLEFDIGILMSLERNETRPDLPPGFWCIARRNDNHLRLRGQFHRIEYGHRVPVARCGTDLDTVFERTEHLSALRGRLRPRLGAWAFVAPCRSDRDRQAWRIPCSGRRGRFVHRKPRGSRSHRGERPAPPT